MNGRHLLLGSVISVQNSNFVYPSCQNCFSKLRLDSKRYSCFKCGSSGDTKEANYRYRLSLEVADTRGIFEVTVFGSCLDVYFGVTAKDLQRYPTALIACQMLLPNLELTGDPVIHYLQQHPRSHFKHGHGGLWPPDLFAAFDEPSGELSSFQASGDLNAAPSSPTNGISNFWPQSFGLTCSSTPSATVADLADLNSSTTAYNQQKWEINPLSLPGRNSQDHNLTRTKRNEEEGKKCHLWNPVKSESESCSSLGGKDCQLVQPSLKLAERGSSCKIVMQHTYGLKHSRSPLPPSSLVSLASSSNLPGAGENSQEDPGLWDDLPSSESLNKFIAKMENSSSMLASKAEAENHFPNNGTEELCRTLTPKPGICSASVRSRQAEEKPQNLGDEMEKHTECLLPYHQSSLLLYHSKDDSHQEAFHSSLTMERNKEWGHLANQHPILLPPCSPTGVELSHSQGSRSSSKGILHQDVGSFTSHHAGCTSQSPSHCLEVSGLLIKKITAHLSREDHGHLADCRGEEGPSYKLNPTTDLLSIQREGYRSANGRKPSEMCRRKQETILEAHEYSFQINPVGWLPDRSDCPEGGYNASADLFDSHRGAETSGRELNSVQDVLAQACPQECSVTKQHIRLEPIPHELDASWNNSGHDLFSCNRRPTSDQKTSTPVSGLTSTSELSLMDSLDFIPHSQSTPLTRATPQASRLREKESTLSKLPPKKISRFNAKCKRFGPPLQNSLVKQLVSKFLKCRRLNTADSIILDASAPHQSFIHGSLLQEIPAKAGEDWIPPSGNKRMQPLPFQKTVTCKSLGRNDADGQGTEEPPISENKIRCGTLASFSGLIMGELSPKREPLAETKGGIHPRFKNDASTRQLVDGSGLNLSTSSHPVPNIPNWSPELF
ncbi:hypothetical protein JRQ81_019535 [Phrynocephalus forsythii]|uniref:Replication factor A C-terminal domain-containing protein n=1 Tax=Phrynocephalus forsythii TaxID=171643 RepID=A0A9Q0XMK6_9SAUR|nr:hypothetical protein JRQ81_019535 [Phrynocephalus forsythii]